MHVTECGPRAMASLSLQGSVVVAWDSRAPQTTDIGLEGWVGVRASTIFLLPPAWSQCLWVVKMWVITGGVGSDWRNSRTRGGSAGSTRKA